MRVIRATGVFLIIACIAGFLTVADDLRHVGELIGVSAIGIAGLLMFGIGHYAIRRRGAREHTSFGKFRDRG